MKKIIAALLAAGICVMLCACSADVLNSVDAGNNSAGDEVEDEMQETEQGEDADASEPSDSSDEDSSDESESYTDYQSVLDAYTLKLQEAVPILVEEYKEEAPMRFLFFCWVGKPPALPVEVSRKKALASSIE